ncbi:MAG TPA: thioester domain-containing protein [Candidatus Limnocylindrales bacterium]|jgi:hypothetical protein
MARSLRRGVALVAMLLVGLAATPSPVSAQFNPDAPPGRGLPAHITLSGIGPGQGVNGGLAPASFDPLGGYPATIPAGSDPEAPGFAGVIQATTNTTPPEVLEVYCIDLRTNTEVGISYTLGTWDAASVPNTARVARILNDYYPNSNLPSGAANNNERGAAVQSAIWFFTDNFVLATDDPLRPLTEAIVADVLAKPPLVEPTLAISLTGPATGFAGHIVGPYSIATTASSVVVHVTGGSLFSDAAGTVPVADGDTIPSSTKLYLKVASPGTATISVAGAITGPSGRVLLYAAADPANPVPPAAQKLIIAGEALVTATDSVTVRIGAAPTPTPTPPPAGSVEPTATTAPSGGVEGVTSKPLPATETVAPVESSSNGAWLTVAAVIALAWGLAFDLRRRRRSDRGERRDR